MICQSCGLDPVLAQARAVQLERLLSKVDTFALAAAEARVRELEETVSRLNSTRPNQTAVEVVTELARMDPRDNTTLACLFCLEPNLEANEHRRDCMWRRAVVVAVVVERERRKAAS